ncbi:MAG: DUF5995 family protein [Jatrophihabitans sp.]|uniref:DUF5995 family protein n=1 Tax=Jatrophihabitans sp. TaxID=1932789 RepID=UPI003F7E62AC
MLIAMVVAATPARADLLPLGSLTGGSTPYTPWSTYLPGWNDQFVPSSSNDCAAGRSNCLTATLKEQTRILGITGQSCSHLAVFPLAYVRMTQTYGWTRSQAGYYQDVPYMNHMDAIFAKYYTDAYYNYVGGNRAAVPGAWQYAFDAATNETVTGAGDLFLGMNAHINRDLPFVLYASGLVNSSGVSGKADYDKVEQWLSDDTSPLLAEEAARFDPTIDDVNNPLIDWATFQMVSGWREMAWRNAEALAAAPDAASRAQVAANIENYANSVAQGMLVSFAVNPLQQTNAARDAYCAAHNGAAAPQPYPMGNPAPYGNTVN